MLHAGGFPFKDFGITNHPTQTWWAQTNAQGGKVDVDWKAADYLYYYMKNWAPYGLVSYRGTWSGGSGSPYVHPQTPSGVIAGDPIFFDYTNNGSQDHAVIQSGVGTTTDGYGPNDSYIDQHSKSRYHSFWSGWTYNAYRNTTKFSFFEMVQ